MRGKKWFILLPSLVIVLLASSIGVTRGSFIDQESSSGNTFQAWASNKWVQTTQQDFEAGVPNNVDTSSSPGDVKLASVSGEPTSGVGSEESWYYASWSRRAPVTINNPGSGLTDYQVKVDVTYDADMQPDFDDIRFRDSDSLTELSHWREDYIASTSATFWVKVPSIPVGAKTIYMYYGNATASSASDGTATFLFYDDFEGGSLDTKWTLVSDAYATNWPFSSPANYTYDSAKIEVSGGYAQLVQTSTPTWWDTSYGYRRQVTISTTLALPAGYSVNLTFDHAALTPTKSQADGDDIRIVYWTGSAWTELDRVLDDASSWESTSTKIWFKTQAGIAGSGSDNNYYLYYGNSSATNPPADGSNVYFFEDLFNRTASSTVGDGWTEVEATGADARIAANTLVSTNVLDLYGADLSMDTIAKHDLTGLTDGCIWEFGFVYDRDTAEGSYEVYMQVGDSASLSDTDPWLGVGVFLSWAGTGTSTTLAKPATAHEMLRVYAGSQTPTEVEVTQGPSNIKLRMDRSAGTFKLYKDGTLKGTYNVYQNVAKWDTVRFVSDRINPSNIVKRGFDYVHFYFAVDPEPTVSAGAEAVPSYPSDAPTIQPVSGQPYTELFTFTETLGPANQGQVKYQISNDGTSWYYHDGISWVAATGFAQTNTTAEVNANISSFDNDVGTGTFYFKAFLSSDGTQQVQLDQVSIETDGFWSCATDQKRSGNYSLKAGITSSSNKYISATGINQADVAFDAWWYNTATTPDICQNVRASTATPLTDYHINWEGQWTIAEMPWNPLNSVAGSLPQNTWFKMTVIIQGTSMKVLKDEVQINPDSGWLDVGTKYASGSIGFRAWDASNNWWIDDVKVRKYALQEPTTSIGSEESWYYTSWSRRAPVTISNPGSGLTDYQVKVDVTYDADMQPDFDDIRFRDSDDSTELSHWRESYTASTSATFWVKVPSIPSGSKTIYMYYGNATASSASDGNATFLFFDDFDDASLGADWTFSQIGGAIGSYAESGTVIRLTGTNTGDLWGSSDKFLFLSISGNYDNVLIESYTSAWGGTHDTWSKMGGVQLRQSVDAGSKNRIMSPVFSATGATNSYRLAAGGITDEQTTTTSPYYNRVSRTGGASRAWYSTDGTTWTELGSEISFTGGLTDPVCLGIHLAGLSTTEHWVEVDWFRVRKYAQPIHVSSGTIASQVLDTGVAGARWDALFWDEILQASTDITFEVRVSDTLFAKGDASPSWTPVGGTSPVTSALPSGRYMQWRATLTTSDTSKKPTLHEVRVYHY